MLITFWQQKQSLVNSLHHTIDSSGRILWIRHDHKWSKCGRLNAVDIVLDTIKKIINSLNYEFRHYDNK